MYHETVLSGVLKWCPVRQPDFLVLDWTLGRFNSFVVWSNDHLFHPRCWISAAVRKIIST